MAWFVLLRCNVLYVGWSESVHLYTLRSHSVTDFGNQSYLDNMTSLRKLAIERSVAISASDD